jgi:hypothetical protein
MSGISATLAFAILAFATEIRADGSEDAQRDRAGTFARAPASPPAIPAAAVLFRLASSRPANNDPPEPPDWEDPTDKPDPIRRRAPAPDDPSRRALEESPTAASRAGPQSPPSAALRAAPGTRFDLERWKLNVPVELDGSRKGYSPTIWQPKLNTFQMPGIFELNDRGDLVFTAPVVGVRTSNSTKYTRTELRETEPPPPPGSTNNTPMNSAWLPEKGTHILESEFTILEFPKTDDGTLGSVIIGQIHGPEDELVRFYVDGATGEAYFVDDKAGPKRKETKFSLVDAGGRKTKVRIGDRVRRRIEVRDRVLTVTAVVNGRTYSASEPLSAFWANKPCYFKDGVYNAVHALDVEEGVRGAGRARVAFHKLGRPTHY